MSARIDVEIRADDPGMTKTQTIIGEKPNGTATGQERWVTITADDETTIVTAYRGWGECDRVRLEGHTAEGLAAVIAETLYEAI